MYSVAEYLDRYGWQPKLERLDIYPRQRSEDNPETLLEIFQQNLKGEKANRPLGTITFFQAKASVLVLDLEVVELNPWPKKAEDWLRYLKEIDNAIDNNAYRDWETDRKSTRLNSSHRSLSRMPSSA